MMLQLANIEQIAARLLNMAKSIGHPYGAIDFNLKNRNDIVVEHLTGRFKVYKTRPFFTYTEKSLSNFAAIISFEENQVIIKFQLKKGVLVFIIIWFIFLMSLSAFSLAQDNFGGLIFILFMILCPIILLIEKQRFKDFIVNFLKSHIHGDQ